MLETEVNAFQDVFCCKRRLVAEMEAWQTLKAAVLAQQTTNTASAKLPEFDHVEKDFAVWWHKENSSDRSLSYRNLKQFYDMIVG